MSWTLLEPLSDADREEVLRGSRLRRFRKGEIVVHEGDMGDSLHLIKEGKLSVRVSTPHGDSATLNVLGPGAAFGELALIRPSHRRTATVAALEAASTLSLSASVFAALCKRHPTIERLVVSALAVQVDMLSHRLLESLYVGADRRVFRRLLELAEVYSDGQPVVSISLTQDDIAGLAGTTRPTVNQILQRLADQGIVQLGRGHIRILDMKSLKRRAATDTYPS